MESHLETTRDTHVEFIFHHGRHRLTLATYASILSHPHCYRPTSLPGIPYTVHSNFLIIIAWCETLLKDQIPYLLPLIVSVYIIPSTPPPPNTSTPLLYYLIDH